MGYSKHLGYIKRRYAHGIDISTQDIKDGDVVPSRYIDLQLQFNFLTEKVNSSVSEIESLNSDNTKLHILCREIFIDTQKSLQKALILISSLLGQTNGLLYHEIRAHLSRLHINLDELIPMLKTEGLGYLIEKDILNDILGTNNCKNIIDSLIEVLNEHLNRQNAQNNLEDIKKILLKKVYNEISQRLFVPIITPKLALNFKDEVHETRDISATKKNECFDDFFKISDI